MPKAAKLAVVGLQDNIGRWYKNEIIELGRIRGRVLRDLKRDYGLEGYHLRTIHRVVSRKGRVYFYRKRYWYKLVSPPKEKRKLFYVGRTKPEIEEKMRKVEEMLERKMKVFPLYWQIENIEISGSALIMDESTYGEVKKELPEHLLIRPEDLL